MESIELQTTKLLSTMDKLPRKVEFRNRSQYSCSKTYNEFSIDEQLAKISGLQQSSQDQLALQSGRHQLAASEETPSSVVYKLLF